MGIESAQVQPESVGWRGPLWIALAGAVMVVVLVALPIYIRVSEAYPMASCGNALVMDLSRWPVGPLTKSASRVCTRKRVDRFVLATGVVAVTVAVVTMTRRGQRREQWRLSLLGRTP
jgi:hypothetical protein